jgi:hypothetical protein
VPFSPNVIDRAPGTRSVRTSIRKPVGSRMRWRWMPGRVGGTHPITITAVATPATTTASATSSARARGFRMAFVPEFDATRLHRASKRR